jgi:hypothetical protein
MTLTGSKAVHQISDDAYNRKLAKEGLTSQQKQQEIIQCEFCQEIMQTKSIKKHHYPKNAKESRKTSNTTNNNI